MKIDEDKKVYIWARDAQLTADPTGSTVEVEIDGTRYPMVWQGSPVSTGAGSAQRWTQTARTTYKFAGSTAPISGTDVRLVAGDRFGKVVVTTADGQIIDSTLSRISVS